MTDSGAHFYRCDLQVHTPRDANWHGRKPVTATDRSKFAEDFIRACRSKGVGAVAITDHHDVAFFPYIRAAALAELLPSGESIPTNERIVVFPAVELTLGVPCQALLILDADFPEDRLVDVLKALSIEETNPSRATLPSVVVIEHINSLKQLQEELDKRPWLRGRYIVLPNVTNSGHQTLLRKGYHPKYKEMPCVGGYLDGSIADLGPGNRAIVEGKDPNYGNKAIAIFQTSDSRSETFEKLGEHSTWVKWSTPTAEALRQACLARESRVSQAAPELPNLFISRVSVSNSKFLGPVELEFNAQYNAIIGGRGTGKSTLLEYLRWTLCDQRPSSVDPADEITDSASRQRSLIAATLAQFAAHVDVHLYINGISHIVRRHAGTGAVEVKVAQGEFASAGESDVRSLLPIHAYSQKQLSSVAVRLDELTRFVTAPIQTQLEAIDARRAGLAAQMRQNYAALQRYRRLDADATRARLALASLQQQAANLRNSLENISEEDREVLAQKPIYDAIDGVIAGWERRLEQAADAGASLNRQLGTLLDGMPTLPPNAPSTNADLVSLESESRGVISRLRDQVSEAVIGVQAARDNGSTRFRHVLAWRAERGAFEDRYERVKLASTAHESKLRDLADIEHRQTETLARISSSAEELESLGDPTSEQTRIRTELLQVMRSRSDRLIAQCEELTRMSEGQLRAGVHRAQGLADATQRLKGAVSGSGVRSARIESLFTQLANDSDPIATWELVLDELESIIDLDPDTQPRSEDVPVLTRLGLIPADIVRMSTRLTPEGWLDLALTPISDHPYFEYRRKAGEYVPFLVASAGQQATALLRILLNQGGPPLLIDQPEEDLDSQVVQEVVSLIWTAKRRRQLIFTSHNANLVVNGDAELVLCCDYRAAGDQSGGRIKLQGAIDVGEVREEITKVMEGGEKAFRLRKEKYGF